MKQLKFKTEQRLVKDLVPYKYNPRTLTADKKQKLKESLTKFDLAEIPVINTDNVIIAGHQRIVVLLELGRGDELIDVRVPNRKLTDAEFKEYNVRSNIQIGEWDAGVLEEIFGDLDLDHLGFDFEGLDWNQDPEINEAAEDNYEAPEDLKIDVIEGDLITFEKEGKELHRLLCGDSTKPEDVAKLMEGTLLDLSITDPPYNVDYSGGSKARLKIKNDSMKSDVFYAFLLDFSKNLFEVTKKGGAWYVWHSDTEGANFRKSFISSGMMLKQCLIWVKNSFVMSRQDYHWKHEPCLYGWKPGAAHTWHADRKQSTVLEFNRPLISDKHPTMKPIDLIGYLIENSSGLNEVVGDFFLGSGSTMVAAHQLNRLCKGMELDPKYCQVVIDRMHKLDASLSIKINGNEYKAA